MKGSQHPTAPNVGTADDEASLQEHNSLAESIAELTTHSCSVIPNQSEEVSPTKPKLYQDPAHRMEPLF